MTPERAGGTSPLRDLRDAVLRPLALPFVWQGLEQAKLHGSPGEVVQRARLLLELLPRFTAAQTHFAAHLAFEGAVRQADPEARLDRLLGALTMLERSAMADPDAAATLYLTMASFVNLRSAQDPELAAAWRRRFGADPTEREQRLLARAREVGDDASALTIREREIYLWLRIIAGALWMHDDGRARATIDVARAQLPELRDVANAAIWDRALSRLAEHLDGLRPLADLDGDVFLEDFVTALRGR